MPAGLPGSTSAQNLANPSAGQAVLFDLLSGPKGSPFDRDVQVPYLGSPGGAGFPASGNASTGALSNGIGFGPNSDDHVRFALIENEQRIQQACRQLRKGLTKLG